MRKLTHLNTKVTKIDGTPYQDGRICDLFARFLGDLRNVPGDKKLLAYQLGISLLSYKEDEMEVNDDQVNILKIAIEQADTNAAVYYKLISSIQ